MQPKDRKAIQREILLGLWKIHILHHAAEEPVVGQWMLKELREHGYDVSPGTLYPILHRMENLGWLSGDADPSAGPKAKRFYAITKLGREVLAVARGYAQELTNETNQGN